MQSTLSASDKASARSTRRPVNLYHAIVEAVFDKASIRGDERRSVYKTLSFLEEKGVDLSPALNAEQFPKTGKNINAIRKEFEKTVAGTFNITLERIFKSKERTQDMSYKRRACYAVLLMRYHITSGEIAKYFDTYRDRTTIVYNLKKHLDDYKYNQKYNEYYRMLLDATSTIK